MSMGDMCAYIYAYKYFCLSPKMGILLLFITHYLITSKTEHNVYISTSTDRETFTYCCNPLQTTSYTPTVNNQVVKGSLPFGVI